MKRLLKSKKSLIEFSLLTIVVLAAGLLLTKAVTGSPARTRAGAADEKGKDCPNDPECNAIVRSLRALNASDGLAAVRGENTSGVGNGIEGVGSVGVRGDGSAIGVLGDIQSTRGGGIAVLGLATESTGTIPNTGVRGETLSFSGSGVHGIAWATGTQAPNPGEGRNFGVRGESVSHEGTGVYGLVTHESGANIGVRGESGSPNGIGVRAINSAPGGVGLWVTGGTVFEGDVDFRGNLFVQGAKSSVADVRGGKRVALYAVESPESWFEDFGSVQLRKGTAVVRIREDFTQTVNTGGEYHVFLTPKANCNGLYVTSQTPTSFEVRELNGGASSIVVDYRIVAKRRGHEKERLEEVR